VCCLQVTVDRIPPDEEKVEKALDALKKRKVKLVDTDAGYAAQVGDSAFVNMKVRDKRRKKTQYYPSSVWRNAIELS